jgi:glycosyltransferase involved in cell wall biosynthesis
MTKILLVANTDWYLYNFRLALARFIREQGCEVVLISPPGKFTASFDEQGFRWIPWEIGRQTLAPWQELPSILQIARIYRQEQPDLIHHHTIKPVIYGSLAARVIGIQKVVNSIPGRGYVFLAKNAKARLLRPVAKGLYRLAFSQKNYAAIFENDADRQYFIAEKFISPNRAFLIAGVGVDPHRFQPPNSEPDGPPAVLYSGWMLWDKAVGCWWTLRASSARRLGALLLAGDPDPGNPSSIDDSDPVPVGPGGVVEWLGGSRIWPAFTPQPYRRPTDELRRGC